MQVSMRRFHRESCHRQVPTISVLQTFELPWSARSIVELAGAPVTTFTLAVCPRALEPKNKTVAMTIPKENPVTDFIFTSPKALDYRMEEGLCYLL
jgi:hypothetical protein